MPLTRSGHPSLAARWTAAQRLRLERTRPSTPGGDVGAEHRLYRAVAGGMSVALGTAGALAQRTQVIDAEVARALGHGTSQLVLLGAGDDGRALRFGGGATRWYEVDEPQAQADKRNRLVALGITTNATTYVPLDLRADDLGAALGSAGHDTTASSLFVAEDAFDTLTLEAAAATCTALRERAAPGSTLVATFSIEPEGNGPARVLRSATRMLRQAAQAAQAAPAARATGTRRGNEWRPGDPQKLLVVTGWRVTHAESSSERRLDPGAHQLIVVCDPDPAPRG